MLNGGDPMNGSPMPNVPVHLLGLPDEASHHDRARTGTIRFANLPAGNYIVYPFCPQHRFEPLYIRLSVGPDNPVGQASFVGVDAGAAVHWLRGFVYGVGGRGSQSLPAAGRRRGDLPPGWQ